MASRRDHYARRYQHLMAARGGPVTIRAYSSLAGPNPAPNPARIVGLVADGAQSQGATSLLLRASTLAGRFIAGDAFLAGSTLLGRAASQALPSGLGCTVALAYPLAQALADGDAITVDWLAEFEVQAQTSTFGPRLVDGEMILQRDLRVTVAANDLPSAPTPQWQIVMPDGDVRSVVGIVPSAVDGIPISYALQAR